MPLLTRLRAALHPWLTTGPTWRRAVAAFVACVAFGVALLPAIGFELVRRLDRERRLSIPVTWVVGGLIGFIAIGALGSMAPAGSGGEVPAGTAQASSAPVATTPAATSTLPTPTAFASTEVHPTPEPTPAATAPLGSAPQGPLEMAQVVRVVDGDTIVIDRGFGDERLRYIGIDTPETVAPGSPVEWMGPEASAANRALVEGREVVLERDVSETDRFGRLLRYVWLRDEGSPTGWLFVNLELLARGYAQVTTYPPDVRYVDLYLAAQRSARDAELGLWGQEPGSEPTPEQNPESTPKATKAPSDCHPSYEGACLKVGAGDYDCAGGSGNGPNYVRGPVYVVGDDEFRLDTNGDGVACE